MVGSVIDFWVWSCGTMIDVGIIGPTFGTSKKWRDHVLDFLRRFEVMHVPHILSISTLIDILRKVRVILFIYSGIQVRAQ